MTVVSVFFTVFFVLALIVGPLIAEEDRRGFKRPDVNPRQAVGSWFHVPNR
jgi:hypothetical protein